MKCLHFPTNSGLQFKSLLLSANAISSLSYEKSYEKTLKSSGFKTILSYVQDNSFGRTRRKLRKKKVFYYNPPFSSCIKMNVGTEFLKHVSKHFPKSGSYGSIFNRKNFKDFTNTHPLETQKRKKVQD